MNVLVVDDEPDVANTVKMGIAYQRPDYRIVEAHSGADALERAARERWDLVILDLTMPVVDGYTVLGALRGAGSDVPIIVLTARDAEQDRVRGLELGADDYVTKPFSQKELVARMDAVMRRYRAVTEASRTTELVRGDLRIDFAKRSTELDEAPVDLTFVEFEILAVLARHPGRVYTRDMLLDRIWGDSAFRDQRTIDVHIRHLREKLERDPKNPEYLLTVRGVGYRFRDE
jgi:DNA-binding response OmpR family regulator